MPRKRTAQSPDATCDSQEVRDKKRHLSGPLSKPQSKAEPGKESAAPSLIPSKTPTDDERVVPQASSKSNEEAVIHLHGQQKPSFVLPAALTGQSLHDRLQSFLPELAASNKALASNHDMSMEDVGDEDEHIMMELGLGVLQEQPERCSGDDSSNTDTDSVKSAQADAAVAPQTTDEDTMRKLLGRAKTAKQVEIEEVD